MLSLFSAVSSASVFTVDHGLVLDPAAHPLTTAGVGAPTIAWDPDDQLFVMFFETQVAPGGAAPCWNGQWAIGAASSADGLTWDVWDDLVVEPTPGTPYACVAAHPAVVYDAGQFHLWFKAEQGSSLPRAPLAAWEADNYTGVGYATVDVAMDDKTAELAVVDAQIQQLEADRETAIFGFRDALEAYEAQVLAQQDEFACLASAPICAPCATTTLSVSAGPLQTRSQARSFCQDYAFTVPSSVQLTTGATIYGSATLSWDGGSCTTSRLLVFPDTYSCTAPVGSTVTTRSMNLSVTNLGLGTIRSTVTRAATNVQTVSGTLLSRLDTLVAFASIPNVAQVTSRIPPFVTSLDALSTWLAAPPVTPDEAWLATQTTAMRADAVDLLALLGSIASQLAALEAERDALAAYVPGVTAAVATDLALPLPQKFGYPSVAKLDGEYVMLLQQYPDLYRAAGATPDAFVLDPTPVMEATSTVTWANSEIYEPSMFCDPGSPFPYGTWVAGRSTFTSQFGASDTFSDDGVDWLLNTVADFTWTSADAYRHFDVIADDRGALRMYHVQRVGGVNEVHLQATSASWTPAQTLNRACAP